MRPIKNIRKNIFKVRQAEFATIAGVTQATISRWEADDNAAAPTLEDLARIREEASRRRLRWNDKLFFDAPPTPPEQRAAS